MAFIIQTYVTDIVKVASFVGFYKSCPSFFWRFIGNIGEVQDSTHTCIGIRLMVAFEPELIGIILFCSARRRAPLVYL